MIRERSFLWKWFFIELFVPYIVHSKETVHTSSKATPDASGSTILSIYIEMDDKVQPFLNLNF
jgi:hypothetical protein